jgi:hypothetical protein
MKYVVGLAHLKSTSFCAAIAGPASRPLSKAAPR